MDKQNFEKGRAVSVVSVCIGCVFVLYFGYNYLFPGSGCAGAVAGLSSLSYSFLSFVVGVVLGLVGGWRSRWRNPIAHIGVLLNLLPLCYQIWLFRALLFAE